MVYPADEFKWSNTTKKWAVEVANLLKLKAM